MSRLFCFSGGRAYPEAMIDKCQVTTILPSTVEGGFSVEFDRSWGPTLAGS